jgi:hypothetical protein
MNLPAADTDRTDKTRAGSRNMNDISLEMVPPAAVAACPEIEEVGPPPGQTCAMLVRAVLIVRDRREADA